MAVDAKQKQRLVGQVVTEHRQEVVTKIEIMADKRDMDVRDSAGGEFNLGVANR